MMQSTWIFQLQSPLEPQTADQVKTEVKQFLTVWNAHGTPVPGKVDLPYNRFITIEAEPGATSGCSIDKMTRTVRDIVQRSGNVVLEPHVVFYQNEGEEIKHIDFREIDGAISSGELTAETTIFDASMNQSSDLQKWRVPLKETWLSRYL